MSGPTLKIKNWDRWQSYRKDRGQPPWIKIHRCVMRNPEWVSLSDAERGQLVSIWLLAADHDGVIPASPDVISKLCFMDGSPNLNKFIELDFIESNGCRIDATMTSPRRQDDQPDKRRDREETEKEKKKPIRARKAKNPKPKKFIPPSLDDVKSYFKENGYSDESAETFHKYYSTGEPPWYDGRGKPVKSWKQKAVAVWFKDENKHVEGKMPWHI